MDFNTILNNINDIASQLFNTVEGEVYESLDNITSISTDIMNVEPLSNLFNEGSVNGIMIIANSLLMFYATYYIFTLLISLFNGNKAENVYAFMSKMLIVTLFINNSYFLCESVLNLNESLEIAISDYGKDICNQNINFTSLKDKIVSIEDFLNTDLISLDGIIKGVISFGSISILINLSIRYVFVIILIFLFPISIALCVSDLTLGLFYNYIKIFITNLLIGSLIKVIIIIPLMYKDTDSTMYKIILVGSIYIIYKINNYSKEIFTVFKSNKQRRNIYE